MVAIHPSALTHVGNVAHDFDKVATKAKSALEDGCGRVRGAHLGGTRTAAAMGNVQTVWDGQFDKQRRVLDAIGGNIETTANTYVRHDNHGIDLFAAVPMPDERH